MANAITTPGLLTCNQRIDYAKRKAQGYGVMWFQHYNRGARGPLDTGGDYDFTACRAAGMDAGVWAVVYEDEAANQHQIGVDSARRAVALGAQHLMYDCEPGQGIEWLHDLKPLVNGVQEGGWQGPIHLTPVGAPEYNPAGGFWDYGYDLEPFLVGGGGIFPQCYYYPTATGGRHPNYDASVTLAYYHGQLAVPKERLNLMIWPNTPLPNSNSAEIERDRLAAAGMGQQMSVFLEETTQAETFTVLEAISKPPPSFDPAAARLQAIDLLEQIVADQVRRGLTEQQVHNQRAYLSLLPLKSVQDATWVPRRDGMKQLWGVTP